MSKENQNQQSTECRERIALIKKALVDGAKSLHITPIKHGDKETTRLPLVTWIEGKTEDGIKGRFFIIALLSKHYGARMSDIAKALIEIKEERLAYIDTLSIRIEDIKDVTELLETAMFVRGTTGKQAVALEHQGKIYVRDLNQAEMSKGGKKGKPIVVPDFMFSLLPGDSKTEPLTVVGGAADKE